jgi:predicted phage-related endonuclease
VNDNGNSPAHTVSLSTTIEHREIRQEENVAWPHLSQISQRDQDRRIRLQGIGGSDANVILSGDLQRIRNLWLEKRGEKEPEDLSASLAVVLGCWTEPFNRQWYETISGNPVSRAGDVIVCREPHWRRCTLDGFVAARGAVWEAKHTSAFATLDQLLERYMPQLQHNMAVANASTAILSAIFGNHKYEIVEVASDWLYQLELLDAEADFWDAVQTGREPIALSPPPAPKPIGVREVCLEGNNAWASAAVEWIQHRSTAKIHAAACATIKSLVDHDVARAFGHGIEAKRSKAGSITIRELA